MVLEISMWEALQYKHLNIIFLFYFIVKPQNKLFSLEFTHFTGASKRDSFPVVMSLERYFQLCFQKWISHSVVLSRMWWSRCHHFGTSFLGECPVSQCGFHSSLCLPQSWAPTCTFLSIHVFPGGVFHPYPKLFQTQRWPLSSCS